MIRMARGEVQTEARLLAAGATMAACLISNDDLGRTRERRDLKRQYHDSRTVRSVVS